MITELKNNLVPNKKMKIIPILTGYGLTAVLKMLGMYYKTSRAKRISIKTHQRVTHLGACLIDDHFSDLILDPLRPLCHENLTFGNVVIFSRLCLEDSGEQSRSIPIIFLIILFSSIQSQSSIGILSKNCSYFSKNKEEKDERFVHIF